MGWPIGLAMKPFVSAIWLRVAPISRLGASPGSHTAAVASGLLLSLAAASEHRIVRR